MSSLDQARLLAKALSVLAKHCCSPPPAPSTTPYALRLLAHAAAPSLARARRPRLPAFAATASAPRFQFRSFSSETGGNEGAALSQARDRRAPKPSRTWSRSQAGSGGDRPAAPRPFAHAQLQGVQPGPATAQPPPAWPG